MASYHMGWTDAAGHPLSAAAGKLLRPVACLWACSACGGDESEAMPAAVAMEWIHNFTLVHDDVQDGDRLRRHRPTVWAIWGVGQAINAGDGLFALAYRSLLCEGRASERRFRAARVINEAVLEVIEGQCLDLDLEGRLTSGPRAYLRLAHAKTGALLGASLEAGAILAGASTSDSSQLGAAGRKLGAAFQIRDDWLGIWGDPVVTGKPTRSDLSRRKVTFPLVAACAVASPAQKRQLRSQFCGRDVGAEWQMAELITELGGSELTSDTARQLADEATNLVRSCLPPSPDLDDFVSFAEFVVARQR